MYKQTDRFYNNFSFLYPLVDVFLKPQKKKLFDEINNLPDGLLLEIGVGNGSHLKLYKKHTVIGIDTSAAMLKIAAKQKLSNIHLSKMDGRMLLFADGSFDYVVLSHVITVVADAELLLNEVYRVLKPNGRVLILNHFTPDNWLKYIDYAFKPFSKLFHFKSVFYIDDIAGIQKFSRLKVMPLCWGSYFKLLIYQKK